MKIVVAMKPDSKITQSKDKIRDDCVRMLESFGCEVIVKDWANRAFTKVRGNITEVALVVVDWSNRELIHGLRSQKIYPGPIVGVSESQPFRDEMERDGVMVTDFRSFLTTVREALSIKWQRKKKIIGCLLSDEPYRDWYMSLLSGVQGFELDKCKTINQAVAIADRDPENVALIVVGYATDKGVRAVTATGYRGAIVAVSEDPAARAELEGRGVIASDRQSFLKTVMSAL